MKITSYINLYLVQCKKAKFQLSIPYSQQAGAWELASPEYLYKLNDSPASKTNALTPFCWLPRKQLPSPFENILGRMLNGFWNAKPFTHLLVRVRVCVCTIRTSHTLYRTTPLSELFGKGSRYAKLKSVRVHFAYGRIALTLELLG